MVPRFAVVLGCAICLLTSACKKTEAESLAERKEQFQAQQRRKAIENYQQIVKKYPDSEFAPKAQERLRALNATGRDTATK